MDDFHFLYRTVDLHGAVSRWSEVVLAGARRWHCFVWNPERRLRKSLFDMIVSLSRHVSVSSQLALISVPYISLLLIAESRAVSPTVRFVQFTILVKSKSRLDEPATVLFVSRLHPVAASDVQNLSPST
jgi:hypothetical protein